MHPWPGLSDVVQRVGAGEKQPMLAINGLTGLMSFVQAGVAEFHPWGCRAGHLEQPDDVTGKVVRCRKFVAPPVNPEWPLYFTNAAREREQRADATLPIVDWPGIRAPFF